MTILFTYPKLLWLLALPALLFFRRRERAFPVSDLQMAGGEKKGFRHCVNWWLWCVLPAAVLLILGAAEPQLYYDGFRVEAQQPNLVLALDVSGSMEAVDWPENQAVPVPFPESGLPPSRLTTARRTITWLLQQKPAFRSGLVAFAQQPFLVCPLIRNTSLLQARMDSLETTDIADGTSLGEAIRCGVQALQAETADRQRILVLFSDGADHSSGSLSPAAAAKLAAENQVVIHTVGIGGKRGWHPVNTDHGMRWEPVAEQLDEGTLKMLAERTLGTYFPATDAEQLLSAIRYLPGLLAEKTIRRRERVCRALQSELVLAALLCLVLGAYFRQKAPLLQFSGGK